MNSQQERAQITQMNHKEQIKLYKKKLQILKQGIRKQRSDKADLERKNRQLKDRNKALELQIKKKDDKYEGSLSEIRDLKNAVLFERNQREKVQSQLNAMLEKARASEEPKSLWGVGNYLGGFLKKS